MIIIYLPDEEWFFQGDLIYQVDIAYFEYHNY